MAMGDGFSVSHSYIALYKIPIKHHISFFWSKLFLEIDTAEQWTSGKLKIKSKWDLKKRVRTTHTMAIANIVRFQRWRVENDNTKEAFL